MSIESFNQFQKAIAQDPVLQEHLKAAAATSPKKLGEVVVKLGAEQGYSFTLEDMQAAAEATSSSPGTEEALSDQELEMVAGGFTPLIVTTVASRVVTAPVAIAQQENAEAEEGEQTVEEAALNVSGS